MSKEELMFEPLQYNPVVGAQYYQINRAPNQKEFIRHICELFLGRNDEILSISYSVPLSKVTNPDTRKRLVRAFMDLSEMYTPYHFGIKRGQSAIEFTWKELPDLQATKEKYSQLHTTLFGGDNDRRTN